MTKASMVKIDEFLSNKPSSSARSIKENSDNFKKALESNSFKVNESKVENVSVEKKYEDSQKIMKNELSNFNNKVDKLLKDSKEKTQEELVQVAITVNNYLSQVKDVICENLNITKEELDALIKEYSMSDEDLIEKSGIMELMSKIEKTSDTIMLLMDPQFSNLLTNILNQVKVLTEKLGQDTGFSKEDVLSFVEANKDLLAKLNENPDTKEVSNALEDVKVEAEFEDVIQNENTSKSDQRVYVDKNDVSKENLDSKQVKTEEQSETEINDFKAVNSTSDETNEETNSNNSQANNNSFGTFSENILNKLKDNLNVKLDSKTTEYITKQVLDQIKVDFRQEVTSMELQLNPENLGKINLKVSENNGVVTALIVTQNEMVKGALESQINVLKETLEAQGVKVEAIEVTIASHEFEQNFNDQKEDEGYNQSKRKHKFTIEELDEINGTSFSQEVQEKIMKIQGSTVNYSA